ncbi:MAG: carboxypeptidase regulatory-like domain-containing protein [Anaerolineae bacterium]|nr:carboxypeptidase regulatory-like domain-containing protein [Anaerolineae bacterium]
MIHELFTLLTITLLLLVACSPTPFPPPQTATPTPVGSEETVIHGTVYDEVAGSGHPIGGASVHYEVVQSFFPELQEGKINKTTTAASGAFSLAVIAHDTDNVRILIEATGYQPYEVNFAGVDLFGGKVLEVGLTPN